MKTSRAAILASVVLITIAIMPPAALAQATPAPTVFCTVTNDCNSRATSVTATPQGCVCACINRWSGSQCQVCPEQFSMAENCNDCNRPDYIGTFPNCVSDKCTLADCSGNARNWTGTKTLGCVCTCRGNWTGPTCSQCPVGYDSNADCAACAPGYEGYPICERSCTNEGNCSGHATAVTGTAQGTCTCTCRNRWSGSACQTCPVGYDLATDCGSCAIGYTGYPNCVPACDVAVACNSRAIAVTGTPATGCVCQCRNGWTGSQCQTCPPLYLQANDCGSCITGYVGYPNCIRGCFNVQNCSGRATTVSGNATTGCQCNCQNAWTGADCSSCPEGVDASSQCGRCIADYGGYPNCVPICTVATHCSGHATSVSGTPPNACSCTCRNFWTGPSCATCPANLNPNQDCGSCMSGFGPAAPNCNPQCTSANNCNDRAASVSGFVPSCTCNCRNRWTGANCSVCPFPFTGSDCQLCVEGYSGYPNCAVTCTVAANCGRGAQSVSGNIATGCTCQCRNRWTGPTCATCSWQFDAFGDSDCDRCAPGLVGTFPNCAVPCSSAGNCTNNAANVSGNTLTGCTCTCRNRWSDNWCSTCNPIFNASLDCGACANGRQDYPLCAVTCTNATHCNGRATAVNGTTSSGCQCTCRNSWTGSSCQTCPTNIDATRDCAQCVAGFEGYPNCFRQCSIAADCNNRAAHVTGTSLTGCTCQCRNSWTGPTCASCPSQFSASADCGSCASGFGGEYPNCIPLCTTATDCNNRATTANGLRPNCSCACVFNWTGTRCETCPVGYSASPNCNTCAAGFGGYPQCAPLCTVADCSNNAQSVSGNIRTGCSCTCTNRWQGANCSICPPNFDATQACGACASGFTGYPQCTRACQLTADCSGNAVSVSGDYLSGCVCNCRNRWTGPSCNLCPLRFDASQDCGACAPGYEAYPTCARKCTVSENCTEGAISVKGNEITGCQCQCRNKWFGTNCSQCPQKYSPSLDCAECANSSYTNFPICTWECADTYCPSPDEEVFGNDTYGCFCRCRQTASSSCSGGGPGNITGHCAVGYTNWPICLRDRNCSILQDCNNNSIQVSGTTIDGCNCTCKDGWVGDSCQTCPPQYDEVLGCKVCAAGYFGEFPNCVRGCNVIDNCTGHANMVDTLPNGTCRCYCINAYTGKECEICPTGTDVTTLCSSCVEGYTGYPRCSLLCTIPANCSNRATAVSGTTQSGCSCTCRNRWSTADCSVCPIGYDSTTDCASCAPGYGGWPNCSPLCTIAGNCSNNAVAVSGTFASGCACTCANRWTGLACQTCPPGYAVNNYTFAPTEPPAVNAHFFAALSIMGEEEEQPASCDRCVSGWAGYPNCVQLCSLDNDCSGHATNVTGNYSAQSRCQCTCRNMWSGVACQTCPQQFNRLLDCGTCSDGYSGTYPLCFENCRGDRDCNNRSISVSGNTNTGCNCQCRNSWAGFACQTCPTGIDAAADCGACLPGFIGYPNCERACTVATDCSNHATTVTGTVTVNTSSCQCNCSNRWTGPQCSICPAAYDPARACNDCNPNYEGVFPECYRKCNVVDDCNNRAMSASGNIFNGCTCSCMNQWTGPSCLVCPALFDPARNCGDCAPGFSSYPNCVPNCNTTSNCNGNAISVTGNIRDGCTCSCRNAWTGANCSVCPEGFNGAADCGTCAPGFTNYPRCQRACTNAADCSNNAVTVSGNTFDGCVCACRNAWSGPSCSVCPTGTNASQNCGACDQGYIGYPNCALACTVERNCSNNAATVTGTALTGCSCQCRNNWRGDRCDICPFGSNPSADCGACSEGFAGYPNCNRDCDFADCDFRASEVSGQTISGCQCTCRNQWQTSNCSLCPSRFVASADCASCAPGLFNYPLCNRPCTVFQDCSNHANTVGGQTPNCTCSCRNQWTGAQCETCPFPFAGLDCNSCVDGYSGYPNCSISCTNERNCTFHASTVSGNDLTGCRCTCRNQWNGPTCAVCPPQYDPALDCGGCAPGYEGVYPLCYAKCSVTFNCSGNAYRVTGNANVGCFCECRSAWKGVSCSLCSDVYNASLDCSQCANGFQNYPDCTAIPTPAPTTLAPPTTVAPTTLEPTTLEPTTLEPTTLEPTTLEPTTLEPTTLEPTTLEPTTLEPTTLAPPTTVAPTTLEPTTLEPTTLAPPTTVAPTTLEPTTLEPTTLEPTTLEPTTAEPTTLEPTTLEPTTLEPTTLEPTTLEPTTLEPTTLEPTTLEPTTAEPTTTAPPTTLAPTSAAPTTLAPTTAEPTTTAAPSTAAPTSAAPTTTTVPTTAVPPTMAPPTTAEQTTTVAPPPLTTMVPAPTNTTPPVTTLAPTPAPTRAPGAPCTTTGDCSGHASSVSGSPTSGCTCVCRNQWAGATCDQCAPIYNASVDCSTCAIGFGNYPTCDCSRHVTGNVDFTGLALSNDDVELSFLRSVIADLNAEIQSQCGSVSATDATTGYVFSMTKGATGATATVTFDVQSLDPDCDEAEQVSDCVLALLLSGCFPLTRTNANNGTASCTPTSLRKSRVNPCGDFGCAAAEDNLVRGLAPTPAPPSPDDAGVPVWIWVVLVGGVLLVAAAVGAIARYRIRQNSGIFFSDPGRYTKRFDVGVEEEELDTTQVIIDEDVATGKEMEERTKAREFADRMAQRKRGASRFARDVDGDLEWESPNDDPLANVSSTQPSPKGDYTRHEDQPGFMLQNSDAPGRARAWSDI